MAVYPVSLGSLSDCRNTFTLRILKGVYSYGLSGTKLVSRRRTMLMLSFLIKVCSSFVLNDERDSRKATYFRNLDIAGCGVFVEVFLYNFI